MFSILKTRWIAAALLTLACGTQAVRAAEPANPQPAKTAAANDRLTDETLLQMIRGMGYEPYETGTFQDGSKYYYAKIEHDSWTVNIRFALSPSKTVVWLQAYLGKAPTTDKILPEPLRKLIEAQNNGKGRFWMTATSVYYQLPLDNRAVTPQALRAGIEELITNVKETAPLWQVASWTVEGKEAVEYKKKFDAAEKKRIAALAEYGKALAPLLEGKAVDAAKLKQATETILAVTKSIREEMRDWKRPNSEVAKALADAYEHLLVTTEQLLTNEFADVIAIGADTSLTTEERNKKLNAIQERITAKEKPAIEAYTTALAKLVKHYDL